MKNTTVLTGLFFGDEGKGTCTDFLASLASDSPVIVRYNGGPQAGHNVELPLSQGAVKHTFSQFGAGTLQRLSTTFLSEFMLINPINLANEAAALSQSVDRIWDRLFIAESARVITPYHTALNRLRELARGDGRHGSCGQGVGELMQDWLAVPTMVIYARDLADRDTLGDKLSWWRKQKAAQAEEFGPHPEAAVFDDPQLIGTLISLYTKTARLVSVVPDRYLDDILGKRTVIFEGAQGVLLDELYGLHPFTTWSNTTPANAFKLIGDYAGPVETIGITRTYGTRHGPGPFAESLPRLAQFDPRNPTNDWQGAFRIGPFDPFLTRFALDICTRAGHPIDSLAVTHTDYHSPFTVEGYRGVSAADFVAHLNGVEATGQPDSLISTKLLCSKEHIRDFGANLGCQDISNMLGLPVRIRSFGPTTFGKELYPKQET